MTTLTEVDIADPYAMRIVKTIEAEGSFVSGRQSGSTARLVISSYPEVSALANREATPKRWLPSLTVRDRDTGSLVRRPLSRCREVDRAKRYSGSDLTTLLTLDLADGVKVLDSDAILTGSDTVYASDDRMYVATQRWISSAQIEGRTSDVSTQIHAFSTTDPGATEYLASGRVPGGMLSQWSMSERDGYLRVASTTAPPWAGGRRETAESESFVTVLGERDGELTRVGQLGGLGLDEQIYAVRFFDDVGYVVTFRQVDPLYTLDLSDPAASEAGRRAQDPRLLRVPAPGRRRAPARRRSGRGRRRGDRRNAALALRRLRPERADPDRHPQLRSSHLLRRRVGPPRLLLRPRDGRLHHPDNGLERPRR